ncbi:MAG: hypothetical protein ACXVOI_00820 [Tumebacillaceae bacterium]
MQLHEAVEHHTLHPIMIALFFVIFAVFSFKVMLNMFKQGNKGLGGFMLISTLVMLFSAFLSSQVSGK